MGQLQIVDREFLSNFVFGPNDIIVTLGQDGLVANTLKYLNGQSVLGINPDPARWDGKLLQFKVADLTKVMPEVLAHRRPTKSVTMAKAALNNGQTLYAVNDLFIGPRSHTSVRYTIQSGGLKEAQSSSGVIVSTGMGSTGWLRSLLTGASAITQSAASLRTHAESRNGNKTPQIRNIRSNLTSDFPWDADYLFFTVREPFPTQTTGTSLVFGRVTNEEPLVLQSQTAENTVIFSDGIEKDFLEFNSGAQAVIGIAERKGVLVQ